MQFAVAHVGHCTASGRIFAYIYFVVAIFDRIHLDRFDFNADARSTFEMDFMGFIAQLHATLGHHCVYNHFSVFRGTSECGNYKRNILHNFRLH